jgi:hypothetical protein
MSLVESLKQNFLNVDIFIGFEDGWNRSIIEASIQGDKADSTRLWDRVMFTFGAGRKSYEECPGGRGVY